ncbi:MAG: TusE/DsrC/DsvC family sulfur relay protein, partial [Chlorobaculum sp.]|nr:TusE/DsrC/DsvC family sulfur relay protein [Chlorobaculum sp.]
MAIVVNGVSAETDENGYLVNLDDWNEEIAVKIAEGEDITMEQNHWDLVAFLRNYYKEYQ